YFIRLHVLSQLVCRYLCTVLPVTYLFFIIPLPPSSTLFPYTTLFRSNNVLLGTLVTLFFLAGCKTQKEKLEFISPANNSKVLKGDRKSTRLNSSHVKISYAVFCLKKKTNV